MSELDSHDDGGERLATAPGAVLAEFERFRHKLGFSLQPAPLIDDRYRIERTLGRGAMGEVHLAYDHRLERSVALKLVRAGAGVAVASLQARIEREALALARVEHANVIGIYDVGTHAGQTYFTMPHVAGATLRDWQAQRPKHELLAAYLQAARGLAAAHACGVVHRDFKPDNVIVGDDGVVRVLDFGIAAALGGGVQDANTELEATLELSVVDDHTTHPTSMVSDASAGSKLASMTRPGTLLGTLPYMASEQLMLRRADARSDQFAFCVALWEAWVGKRPFSGRDPHTLRDRITRGPEGGEVLPRWLRTILVRGLADEPDRRWPSMDALLGQIERVRTRRRKLALGCGGAVALATAVGIGRAMLPAPTLPPGESCEDFVATIDPLWSTSERERLSTGADPDASRYAITTLDELANDWRSAAGDLCEGEAAPARDMPERACLSAWLENFADHVELLAERGDDKTLARAPDLLARLVPPSGDYCALRPTRPVDPELWRAAEHARAAVLLGDIERAFESADAAVERAQTLDPRTFNVDAAAAHAARAEVAAFAGQHELALTELAQAEHHALGYDADDLLLPSWVLGAKLLALSGDPSQAEQALVQIDRAESLVFALQLHEDDPRRAELLEARGLAERGLGRSREAIDLHRRAQGLFAKAGQPTLAGKSLINIGANHQDLDEPEQARQVYAEAVRLYETAGFPPSYRNRVRLELDLCWLAYSRSEPSDLTAGLEHCEFVLAHGTDDEHFEALTLIISLALELDDSALVLRWCEHGLAEFDIRLHASAERRVGIQGSIGVALANIGDPRGEPLLELAEREFDTLGPLQQFVLQRSWIAWLADTGRCSEAEQRRAAFVARMDAQSSDALPVDYPEWRDAGPDHCSPSPNDP